MISKDESIVTQVAAKIAVDLTNTTVIDQRTTENVQATYLQHFDFVMELMRSEHGWSKQADAQPTLPPPPASAPNMYERAESNIADAFGNSTSVNTTSGGSLTVKGIQHGPLPAWLLDAAAASGVTSVYDNRDTANATNRRPLFKAADGTTDKNGKPVAFWAPTARR